MTPELKKLTAWAGIIFPALFVITFTLEDFLRPGYNALADFISALSLGPRGWIQITNFILTGALMFVFTRRIAAEFPTGKASRGGLIFLTMIAVLFMVSGPFVMDPAETPVNQGTVHGTIHGILGSLAFLLMPISTFVYLRRFNSDPAWKSFCTWTISLALIITANLVLFTVSSKITQFQIAFAGWLGLIQRALIVPFMLWMFIFGIKLLKRS